MKNKLNIAFPTAIYPELTPNDIFKKIASYGFRYVSFSVDKELTLEACESALTSFRQLGLHCIQIKSLNMPKSFLDEKHFEEAIEEFNKLSEIAALYDCRQIEVTAGSFRGKKEEHLKSSVKFIKKACDTAQEKQQFCTLEFKSKKNQLIKTWQEAMELYEKVDKENLLINLNTALFHSTNPSEEEFEFLKDKAALIKIQDLKDDNWTTDINIGEGIVDIEKWISVSKNLVFDSSSELGFSPIALLMIKSSDKDEIKRVLKYFEYTIPELKL